MNGLAVTPNVKFVNGPLLLVTNLLLLLALVPAVPHGPMLRGDGRQLPILLSTTRIFPPPKVEFVNIGHMLKSSAVPWTVVPTLLPETLLLLRHPLTTLLLMLVNVLTTRLWCLLVLVSHLLGTLIALYPEFNLLLLQRLVPTLIKLTMFLKPLLVLTGTRIGNGPVRR